MEAPKLSDANTIKAPFALLACWIGLLGGLFWFTTQTQGLVQIIFITISCTLLGFLVCITAAVFFSVNVREHSLSDRYLIKSREIEKKNMENNLRVLQSPILPALSRDSLKHVIELVTCSDHYDITRFLPNLMLEARDKEYTQSKAFICKWADQHPNLFVADQVRASEQFGDKLLETFNDIFWDAKTNQQKDQELKGHIQHFNKFWDAVGLTIAEIDINTDLLFKQYCGDFRILSITQPLEILQAQRLQTPGKDGLQLLLEPFRKWVTSDGERLDKFKTLGFKDIPHPQNWTELWPWRK